MGATLVEKLISKRIGSQVVANQIVSVPIDRIMINDYVGRLVFSKLDELHCTRIAFPERVFLATDHQLPAFTVSAADTFVLFREKAAQYGITHKTEFGKHGIGHQLMVEDFVRPLDIAVATDSHATMYGGIGAFSCGITTSDAVSILMTGALWLRVPETIRIHLTGKFAVGVTAKDVSLHLLTLFPETRFSYKAVEIVGEAAERMSVDERLVLANMLAETGAKSIVFEADDKAYGFVHCETQETIRSDEDAVFAEEAWVDISEIKPMLACPNSVRNVHAITEIEPYEVQQVFIGSCTNGRLVDLIEAAQILRGKTIAPGLRLLITPASQQVAKEAVRLGIMEHLMDAGATILTSSCASCAGQGPGLIGRGERCVSTTNRNFLGRMGSNMGEVYLASAYTAAATALTGRITDPRTLLEKNEV